MRWFHWLLLALAVTALAAGTPWFLSNSQLSRRASELARVGADQKKTSPPPNSLNLDIIAAEGAVLCDVGAVRLALLERSHGVSFGMNLPIAGETPSRQQQLSVDSKLYFTHDYSDGRTDCQVYDLPFVCESGEVRLAGQSFPDDQPVLVMVDADNQIVLVRHSTD